MENSKKYPISVLCELLEVNRAAYYHWHKNRSIQKRLQDEQLLSLIRKYHDHSHRLYGLLRITQAIRKTGTIANKKRVYRLMRAYGIYSRTKKKFKVTTHQDKGARFHENILKGNFEASEPNEIWTSDITYIWTYEGWLYLAVVLEVFTRKIIGWSIREKATADIVTRALIMAIGNQKPAGALIFHSDRGSQYTSDQVKSLLERFNFRGSMSSTGNCYDNAITETFFSTLKKELVYLSCFRTKDQARLQIFQYIETFYNRQRMHSAIGYKSPEEFERKHFRKEKSKEKVLINNSIVDYLCV